MRNLRTGKAYAKKVKPKKHAAYSASKKEVETANRERTSRPFYVVERARLRAGTCFIDGKTLVVRTTDDERVAQRTYDAWAKKREDAEYVMLCAYTKGKRWFVSLSCSQETETVLARRFTTYVHADAVSDPSVELLDAAPVSSATIPVEPVTTRASVKADHVRTLKPISR